MKKIISLLILIICMQYGKANNIEVSNVSIINNGNNAQYVKFDVKWDNSWRVNTGQANYDGAYVFFKYKTANGEWTHVNCKTAASPLNVIPAGFEIGTKGIGLFIYRNANNIGVGNVNLTNIQTGVFKGPFSGDIPFNVEIRAYAVEMVYIPEVLSSQYWAAAFGDGDGTNESQYALHLPGSNSFTYGPLGVGSSFYFSIDVGSGTDDALVTEPSIFALASFLPPPYTGNGLVNGNISFNYPNFPTLGKVWCMKYEITQGAYRDFLNTLTLVQQTTRTANVPTSAIGTGALTTSGSYRNFLEISVPSTADVPAKYGCDASGNNVYDEPTDGEFVACNYLNWPDIVAWLDWSGLMPMTEIQFEHICRGHTNAEFSNPAIFGEFAWGSTAINAVTGTITNPFAATEVVSNSSAVLGNANYSSLAINGPLRNGIFATATSNRITSGASFFGVMDMSGNLAEACVTIGNAAGRGYCKTGFNYGNGELSVAGNADVYYWTGNVSSSSTETAFLGECIYGSGTKNRGGDFTTPTSYLRVSDRSDGPVSTFRYFYQGGRGVYTMPASGFVIL
jgi:hypothetical protein